MIWSICDAGKKNLKGVIALLINIFKDYTGLYGTDSIKVSQFFMDRLQCLAPALNLDSCQAT